MMILENVKLLVEKQSIKNYIRVKELNSGKRFNIFADHKVFIDNKMTDEPSVPNKCFENMLKILGNNRVITESVVVDADKIYYTTKNQFNKINKIYFGSSLANLSKTEKKDKIDDMLEKSFNYTLN